MKHPLSTRIDNIPAYIYWTIFVLFQSLFAFQGLDFADEGYMMTLYADVFDNPEAVTSSFPLWLTGVVGGTLLKLLPSGGLIMMRIAGIAAMTLSAFIASRILRPYLSKWSIRVGLFMAMLLVYRDMTCLCYNRLSIILLLAAIYYLFNSLKEEKPILWKVSLSGALFALNIFSRFPNIIDLVFILFIPYEAWLSKRSKTVWIKTSLYMFASWALTIVAVLFIMQISGVLSVYIDSLSMLYNMGSSSGNSHGILRMIRNIMHQYAGVIEVGGGTLFVALIAIPVMRVIKDRWFYLATVIIMALFLASLYKFSAIYLLYFVSISTTITIVFGNYHKSLKLLAMLSALLNIIYPIGSDYGINIVGYHTFWLSFPLIISFAPWFFASLPYYSGFISSIDTRKTALIGWGILLTLAVFFIERRYSVPYFDYGTRTHKTAAVDHPLLTGIYTTTERAHITEELLTELSKHLHPGDYLVGYDNMPMLNYLTGTHPYGYSSWVLGYDSTMFSDRFSKFKKAHKKLPIVVVQHFTSIKDTYWKPDTSYFVSGGSEGRHDVMLRFLHDNGYIRVWNNKYFSIFEPCYDK